MNIRQMKSAIKKFRAVDVSMIQDEKLRAKAQKLQAKEKGFTLLELLVVITLLAILATGALIAYDGIGENAQAARAASTAAILDQGVRVYRAVELAYPDQWDNLAHPGNGEAAGGNGNLLHPITEGVFGSWNIAAADSAVIDAFTTVAADVWDMEEIQHVWTVAANVPPNKMHNEGSNVSLSGANDGAIETDIDDIGTTAPDFAYISIVPSAHDGGDCTAGGVNISAPFDPTSDSALTGQDVNNRLNAMHDAMGASRCHLVVALGFGGDAAHSTSRSSASIPNAPAYYSKNINPAEHYARYIGLFHLARTSSGGTAIDESHFFSRPKLIGFVDTEGNPIDTNVAAATNQ